MFLIASLEQAATTAKPSPGTSPKLFVIDSDDSYDGVLDEDGEPPHLESILPPTEDVIEYHDLSQPIATTEVHDIKSRGPCLKYQCRIKNFAE